MIIALNNKSNLTKEEFFKYQEEINQINSKSTLILCASTLNIPHYNLIKCHTGSQNVSAYPTGAHTGEITASQLKSYGVEYCIVGHSERRQEQKETDNDIAKKIKQLCTADIIPILCIGETKEEREQGLVNKVITNEIQIATEHMTEEDKKNIIVAYEPIWSIGTGIIPTNEQIEEVLKLIKQLLPTSKVLYGGSANENNISTLKTCRLIDGYLLGGVSLKTESLKLFIEKLEN